MEGGIWNVKRALYAQHRVKFHPCTPTPPTTLHTTAPHTALTPPKPTNKSHHHGQERLRVYSIPPPNPHPPQGHHQLWLQHCMMAYEGLHA